MNKKFIIFSCLIIFHNIFSMQVQKELATKFERFLELAPDTQKYIIELVILNSFESIVEDGTRIEYDIKNLFNQRAKLLKVNKSFKEIVGKNREVILKKFADKLLKKSWVKKRDFQKFLFRELNHDSNLPLRHYNSYPLNEDIMQMVLNAGVDINEFSEGEYQYNEEVIFGFQTPLMVATRNHKIEYMKLLIKLGADVNIRNNWKLTPLMVLFKITPGFSDYYKKSDLSLIKQALQILLDAKADPNVEGKKRKTALFYAKESYCPEIIKMLENACEESKLNAS